MTPYTAADFAEEAAHCEKLAGPEYVGDIWRTRIAALRIAERVMTLPDPPGTTTAIPVTGFMELAAVSVIDAERACLAAAAIRAALTAEEEGT